ncbi:MAG: histidine kinase [Clostridia bacterium]|nr:histidine kinase [Clostridia bacterium]
MRPADIIQNTIGFALQLIPPTILYFLCVPDRYLRYAKKKVVLVFVSVLAVSCIGLGFGADYLVSIFGEEQVTRILSMLLIVAIICLIVGAVCVVRMSALSHLIVLFVVVFYSSMQFLLTNIFAAAFTDIHTYAYNIYDILFSLLTVLLLLPIVIRMYAVYTQEYLLLTKTRMKRLVFAAITVLSSTSIVHVFIETWYGEWNTVITIVWLLLPSVSMMVIHYLFLHLVVTSEQHAELERSLLQSQVELMESRMHLLTAQIQPHFIHNTLNTIYSLCDEDIEDTKQAICDFSDYLRTSFEAMDVTEPVPFQKELDHIMFYLSIEKRRFLDKLNVDYDIQTVYFTLPVLTIQPLVENAVRHGIRQKNTPGKLFLQTRETDTAYEIMVRDDGAGFDPSSAANEADGRKHLGISNSRTRLQKLCGGTLDIVSEPGAGTTVTVRIPKNRR